MSLADWVEVFRELPPYVTWGALFLGAFAEYVVPPVPGDTFVLAGTVLVTAFGWSPWGVYGVAMAGALLGAAVDFQLGRWLVARGKLDRLPPRAGDAVHRLVASFARHGPAYLVLNRFLPGVRPFFFVAAGIAEFRLPAVLLYAGISALLWNALLVGAGIALGRNIDTMDALFAQYQQVMWAIIACVIAVLVYRLIRGARAAAKSDEPQS